MAGARKTFSKAKKRVGILLPVSFLLYGLIKIGQFPIFVIRIFTSILSWAFSRLFAIRPSVSLPHLSFPLHLKKRRGRPRKLPLYIFLFRKFKRFFRRILPSPLRVGIVLGILGVLLFVYSMFLVVVARDLPSPDSLNDTTAPLTTEFYDRNGKLLYRLYEGENRTLVPISDVPQNMINATVSIEDKNFWGHHGVDFFGIGRALIADIQGKQIQGGSTITQQLIKNTLLTPSRTWQRKVKEILLAFWTERLFSKQQILQMYFNSVGYGGPSWGIETAAETYFGIHAKNLDLAQSAYLAGLPESPSTYSPYGDHPELGIQRQHEVLQRMVQYKYITDAQAQQAEQEQLAFKPQVTSIQAPHFVMYVRDLLAQEYGEREVSQGGLKVITSLDLNIQNMAQNVVADEVAKDASLNLSNGAAMVEDPKTGQILAMVGSKDYFDPKDGNFNDALADRQPGSSIKVVTYATAFKQGYSPGSVILDAPTVFYNPWGQNYAPVNYDGAFHGPVTIRTALGSSINIPAVKTLQAVGIPNFLKTAHDMGITTLNDPSSYGLSLTLGAGDVRLIDMMTVYSTLATEGVRHDPTPILKVTDSNGQVLEDNTTGDNGVRVLQTGVAYMIDNILSDNNARVLAFGPNSLLRIPGHDSVAVKTGTTDDKRDNWTLGFTPNYAVGVWVGNNDNSPMNQALASGITGAAPIWNQIMTNLLINQPDVAFIKPPDVALGLVDGHQDLVLTNAPKSAPGNNALTLSDKNADSSAQTATPAPSSP